MPDRQSTNDNNPFAPPPEGQPDQPWQPRRPDGQEGHEGQEGQEGQGNGSGSESGPGWSSSQPGRSSDGFGRRPERPSGGGQGGPEGGQGPGLRWDPTDPAQRRARYAVLSGMWAFFFAIFDIPELALLLGALGLYWAISGLRAKAKAPAGPQSQGQAAGQGPGQAMGQAAPVAGAARSQRTAAISGLVASAVALLIVASGFAMHLVYRDFYECRADALTKQSQLACNDLLPKPLQDTFGVRE
ncbi:hypothetical protein ACFY7C_30710 [Streptomyces sp. NPDC012769]|uniref:hypothetical protein n=1 Tax=Streptomyces sp. NPDC012769 TaxID=3364848 RepID=UPI003693700A